MLDFLMISTRSTKRGVIEVYPKFFIKKSSDLMIRGGDFYAIWVEDLGLWSTDEQDALQLIDRELDKYADVNRSQSDSDIKVLHICDAETRLIDSWHRFCQKDMRDSFHMLDEKLIFSNTPTSKKDYASRRLSYPLEAGDFPSYDRLMSTLYSESERQKIEWAIGSVISGDSKKIQKFIVLYGATGTGKSTVLNIIQQLFEGYHSVFDAKALGSSSNSFALEAFRSNPLVAIQHDGDLSRIEDNTRLNSLVSHEMMVVNEKFKTTYSNRFKSFLFMGTNKPVKITDAKSGLIRRLIDVSPSGNTLTLKEYRTVLKQIEFELGAIAYHCQEVYSSDPSRYDDYIPTTMLGASNDFYNFVIDSYSVFKKENGVTLKAAWEMYKTYCDEAKVSFPFSQRIFKEELKNYFREYKERFNLDDGSRTRSYYEGFRTDKFEKATPDEEPKPTLIEFTSTKSIFDKKYADCLAQYATSKETPSTKWSAVTTKLSDLDTSRLHYVKLPENHVVIDFDIPDKDGHKSLERNLEEASKWPETYAELSKSGNGIHLHYIYTGDVSRLSRIYNDHIEIKIFVGNSSIRRKLTQCNTLPIAKISSGLPEKGEKKVIDAKVVSSDKGLREQIKRNLNKEIHSSTKSSIDFINKILEDAYASGLKYDISDMKSAVLSFGASSTNQSEYCIKLVNKMKFQSEEESAGGSDYEDRPLVFFDVEVFPNLFLLNWKAEGKDKPIVRMVNPTSVEVEDLLKLRLVGFNCRRYDNHILYGRLMGYTEEQLYHLSKKIIDESAGYFGEAYNISYTDVYDFASSTNKKGLKKFEIELGIHHKELGLPWDEPVLEDQWILVSEYCDNDVLATEAVFNHLKGDWTARQILADVADMTVNDTTNSLTTKIIFGNNRKPQDQFNYRDMGDTQGAVPPWVSEGEVEQQLNGYNVFDEKGRPIFPGYKYENGISTYRGEEVGEGGYVYSEPGMYGNVFVFDIASQHPSSIVAENLFGDEYTARYKELLDARIAIKRKDFVKAKKMLGGKLAKYLTDESTASDLANALKTAINSVYGLTAASFSNAFNDPRNKDNIIAKRGNLFMVNLKHEVQQQGFMVVHIKTDSIKIPNATPKLIKFIMDYGKKYGYTFEHEATYERMCIVNKSVYIAKHTEDSAPIDKETGEKVYWAVIGEQFSVPYVFKSIFKESFYQDSHGLQNLGGKEIILKDLCETKSVTTALYLDMNEDLPEGEHNYRFIGRVGQFCPIKEGCGGGILLRETVNKKTGERGYAAADGSKGYRWLETETVRELSREDDVDRSYYDKMVDDALKAMDAFGDVERFTSEDPYIWVPFDTKE